MLEASLSSGQTEYKFADTIRRHYQEGDAQHAQQFPQCETCRAEETAAVIDQQKLYGCHHNHNKEERRVLMDMGQ